MRLVVRTLAGLALASALASPASAAKNNPNIDLEFLPQQSVAAVVVTVSGAMLDTPVALEFTDDRKGDQERIGTRTDDDDRRHPLLATTDVLPFFDETLVETAGQWGVEFDPDARLTLHVRLLGVDIVETNQAVGATYNATVRIAYSLEEAGGEPLASSSVAGDATRYGRKFSNDNCNEVLSDAMLEAFGAMLSDRALQDEWGE